VTGETVEGSGPFATRRVWRRSDGGSAIWESRTARKRGILRGVTDRDGSASEAPDAGVARRLGRLNVIASLAFIAGGLLFALGAAVAQLGSGDPATSSAIYFAGGLCFNTGGYASLLQAINAPRPTAGGDALVAGRWRWWSYEPDRIDWLSTAVLFAGTLVFGVNLFDSFLQGLTTDQLNRLIWAPDVIGCTLFLISGHLALIELSHGRPRWRPHRELGWWIVAINQIGSVLFAVSALASYTRPATDSLVNVDIANWGTLTGALCFAVAGIVQLFERPARDRVAVGA
jgi:hypothetical protein